jgi:predicted AlkP superfamily pyrophosphatase or phosphodiesterase
MRWNRVVPAAVAAAAAFAIAASPATARAPSAQAPPQRPAEPAAPSARQVPAPAARPQRPRPLPASAPRLVVIITVDQMRADYLERFKSQFTGGFARMLRSGADFTDAYQDHAMTETAVGHATILSGRNPASHGIIRNSEGVYDPDWPLVSGRGPGASPERFRGTTLFDWLAARSPGSRMLSVSRKDRGAILPVGKAKQMVFWYAGGQFTTSYYYADSLPSWVQAVNARAVPVRSAGRAWEPLLPADSYPEPDIAPWENGGTNITFPHQMPVDTAAAKSAFLLTPWMDQLTLDFVLAGVKATGLGRGPAPDILAVSLSTTDAIGHTWGPNSREIHDQIVRLDRELGAFLDSLARLRDPRRTVVVLTADHGVTPFSGWARRNGVPLADNVTFDSLLQATSNALLRRAGPGTWLGYYGLGLVVMDRAGLTARGVDVDSVVGTLAAALRANHAVQRVDTPRSLAAADTAQDAIARRWRNAIPLDIGAELMVTLKPKYSEGPARNAEHGQPSDDDTHVPLLFWGAGIRAGTFGQRVSVTDIAPTLAHLLGVEPTEPVQGVVLSEALTRR